MSDELREWAIWLAVDARKDPTRGNSGCSRFGAVVVRISRPSDRR